LHSASSIPKPNLNIASRAAPFAAFIFLLAAFPNWVLLRGAVAALLIVFFWRNYVELRGVRLPAARELVASIAVGLAIFIAWIALDNGDGTGFKPVTVEGAIEWPAALARFAILAAVVPVMEELFWRSFLMRRIDTRHFLALEARQVSRFALILSSVLFATEHSMWVAGLIAGLAFAGLYIKTNNLWAPLVAHSVTNATLGIWILATGSWHLW
jgi:CAAX prenyl protease-like protein